MTTNPDESKDRIERAREYVRAANEGFASGGGNPRPLNQRDLVAFATAENQLLSTRVEELEEENERLRDEEFERFDDDAQSESSTDELINLLKESAVQWASVARLLSLRSGTDTGAVVEAMKRTLQEYGEDEWVKQIRW